MRENHKVRKIVIILSVVIAILCLSACGTATNKDSSSGKMKIVATIFPEYDWVKEIMGDKAQDAEITLLLDNGVDLHSYQPTAEDILKISTCDVFIYVGGESDEWVKDALKNAVNKNICVINLMDVLGENAKEEEMVEGMQKEDGEEDDEEGGEEPEYDEHVWLSLKNAQIFVRTIADRLMSVDPGNAKTYNENADLYIDELKKLDDKYRTAIENSNLKTVLFGDRFPFRYMIDDYGLEYYAAFVGCSAETEASFETISFLSGKIDELRLPAVLTIEDSDKKIAETIIQNTLSKDAKILTMDSMQGVTSKEAGDGITYLSVMKKNLEVLEEALK